MNYAGPSPWSPDVDDSLHTLLRFARRALVLASALFVAFLISGGIFTFTPLVGLRIAHTSGVSMEPAYKNGDVVLIKDVSESDLHLGDIVVFNALGRRFMHRIIEERTAPGGELILVTQGDNVAKPDFPIRASQVSGKLVGEIPILGTVSRLLHAQGGFYVYRSAVLSVAVFGVALWGLMASVRRSRDEREYDEALAAGAEAPEAPRPPTLV